MAMLCRSDEGWGCSNSHFEDSLVWLYE
jgi:hypothetical protein